MATIGIVGMSLVKIYPSSGTPNTPEFPEAASTDFVRGEPVYFVSGYLTKYAASSNNILGMAADDAANSSDAVTDGLKKRALIFDNNQVWMTNVRQDDTGTSVDAIVATDMGSSFGIIESTVSGATNKWVIDTSDTSNKRVTIIGFVDAIGDIYGRVLFKWIHTYLQAEIAN